MGIKKKKDSSNQSSKTKEDLTELSSEDDEVLKSAGGNEVCLLEILCKERQDLILKRDGLNRTTDILSVHDVIVKELVRAAREKLVWEQYMTCNGLPDPICVKELNTYLSLWKEDEKETMDEVLRRSEEVLPIMTTLENLIENPELWEDPEEIDVSSRAYLSKLQERNKIFMEMKMLQLKKLNIATYNILLDVSPMVDLENNVLQHYLTSDLVSLGLWGNVMAKNMRVKGTNFADLGFGFELPLSLMGTVGAVRVMRVKYDHYSKMCRSNKIPPKAEKDTPSYTDIIDQRLIEIEERIKLGEVELKIQLQEEQRAREEAEALRQLELKNRRSTKNNRKTGSQHESVSSKQSMNKKESVSKSSSSRRSENLEIENVSEPLSNSNATFSSSKRLPSTNSGSETKSGGTSSKTPTKSILQERIDLYKINIDDQELNLRRNIILGGVFYFDMLEIPPQPKKVADWIICELETPQALKTVKWKADYKKPNTDDSGGNNNNAVTKKTPEEIEREIKEQEMELQKLVLVHLKLPSSALWFEPPTIVRWESDKGYWSTVGFYDIKFDEGKQTLSFRTLSFGIFALSAFRYSNLPLQSWDLRPESVNSAVITLSAAAVQAEFLIEEGFVTLIKFSSGSKPPVQGIQDKPMPLKDLVKELRMQGVDIFPDYDSHCYIEGLPLKDIQTERHLYYCMALAANSYNYSWSRWNLLSGYDKLIMQYRERLPGKQEGSYQVLLITPEKTSVLECTEASQTFNDKPVKGFEYFADLYSMILDNSPAHVLDNMKSAKAVFVHTVSQMLLSSKVLSYA